jgi:DNA-binding transcriptional LysR family regulator
MLKYNLVDLYNFIIVADEASFTRAAVKLGVTQSALSHAMKGLEKRIGMKLLERTTRRVSLTPIGKNIYDELHPRFSDIERTLSLVESVNNTLSGSIRLAATEIAANQLLWPVLSSFLKSYPNVKVEVDILESIDRYFSNFDAVIEISESVYKDRETIPLSNKNKMVTVVSPLYLERYGTPQKPRDLNEHKTIGLTSSIQNNESFWRFQLGEEEIIIQNEFSHKFNTYSQLTLAVKSHVGIAHIPEMLIKDELKSGALSMILSDWHSYMPGFYLHLPANQPNNRIISSLIIALKNHALGTDD